MAPTIDFGASWRRALTIEAGSDVLKRESESPIFLLSRDDTNSGGMTMGLSPVVGALIVVGIVIVLIALMAVISVMLRKSPHFKKKKQNSSSTSSPQMKEKRKPRPSSLSSTDFTNAFTSPRNSWSGPLSTGSAGPLSERRQKALASLPKIRIDPPKSSSDITVALGTSSSDETMSELQVPQQAKVAVRHPRPAVNADPFSHPQDGMLGSAPEPKPNHVLVSHSSVLPSFYTVSSPKRAESVGKHRSQRKRRSADEYDDEELKNPFEDPHGDGDSPPVSPTPVPL